MITVSIEGIDAAQRLLTEAPKRLPRAVAKALNDGAVRARSESVRLIGAEWNVKSTAARKALSIRRATVTKLESSVEATGGRGRGIPLASFNARQTKRGVSVKLKRAGSRGLLPGAFIATMKSGHRGVFTRRAKSRKQGTPYRQLPIREVMRGKWAGTTYRPGLPILEKMSVSIASMWNRGIIADVVARVGGYVEGRLRYYVGKALER